MQKNEVIHKIQLETGIAKKDVALVVESFLLTVKNTIMQGEDIYIRGFGSFEKKKIPPKIARNFKDNTAIVLASRYVPSFKPSKLFIKKMQDVS